MSRVWGSNVIFDVRRFFLRLCAFRYASDDISARDTGRSVWCGMFRMGESSADEFRRRNNDRDFITIKGIEPLGGGAIVMAKSRFVFSVRKRIDPPNVASSHIPGLARISQNTDICNVRSLRRIQSV